MRLDQFVFWFFFFLLFIYKILNLLGLRFDRPSSLYHLELLI
jgi:hypothetical protein